MPPPRAYDGAAAIIVSILIASHVDIVRRPIKGRYVGQLLNGSYLALNIVPIRILYLENLK